jgi:hypothetical protein
MLTQSEHIDQLAAALADVQALIDGVLKDSPNAVYGSRYADLSKVWEAFQRVGPDHGLSVVQLPGTFDPEARTMAMSVHAAISSGRACIRLGLHLCQALFFGGPGWHLSA